MEQQTQQADVANLTGFGYNQELRLAQTIQDQSPESANGGDYGLAASVWVRDDDMDQPAHPARERGAARRLQAERLRKGHGDLFARGVHTEQTRHVSHD